MKKLLSLGIIFVLVMSLVVGCGSDKDDETITLRLATQHPVNHMAHTSAEAIKDRIETESKGRIQVQIYPANQLGDWTQVFEEIMRGTIDIAHISVPETFDPRITAGFLPYLAKDYDELKTVFAKDSYLNKQMAKFHEDMGVKFLGYYCEGFSGIGVANPVKEPAKMGADKDSLVRVPSIDAFKLPTEALGFRTSTIPYSDTFAAMQTGVVDGWIGGPPNLNYLTFRDVIKHYYQYNLTHECTQYLMNMDKYKALSEEDQKLIIAAFNEQSEKSIDLAKAEDEKYKKLLKEEGIEVVEFSAEELDAMADYVRGNIWPKLTEKYTEELIKGLQNSLK